jgi:hypothetical protein
MLSPLPVSPAKDISHPRVCVARRHGGYCLLARKAIRPGEHLLTIEGETSDEPNRYSVQVGPGVHVVPPAELAPGDDSPRYSWRFLNHSCNPNTALVGRALHALRSIAEGEELTFDYNTTEYDMASPFRCHCGHCGERQIRGFRHLTAAEQRRIAPYLANHLRSLLTPPVV